MPMPLRVKNGRSLKKTIEHLALYVNDLEGAKQFFETYFGASANDRYHNQTTDFKSFSI